MHREKCIIYKIMHLVGCKNNQFYFILYTLIELADEFVKEGGDHLYIDEIHKYDGWSREIEYATNQIIPLWAFGLMY